MFPFAYGVLATLLALILYHLLFPANQLTEREVNEAIASAMASATPRPPDATLVYQVIQPSIVYIDAGFVNEEGKNSKGLGTGVIITDSADIVTSLHVVQGSRDIRVTFADGSESEAFFLAETPEQDLGRVVAEAVIRRDVLERLMRVDTHELFRARQVANAGALLSGSAYNGPHAANGIAAMFIACGQDVANVAESHAGLVYTQLLDNGDYYWAVTLPSLIVASYGGGTGLPTQRECLELLGCYGSGKADKLAEIVAGVVLAGDVSLGCAVVADEWVTAHERLGRNRP